MDYVSVVFDQVPPGGCNKTEYVFKCVFDNVAPGSKVIVESNAGLRVVTVQQVGVIPPANVVEFKYVIDVVDTEAYKAEAERQEAIEAIEREIEAAYYRTARANRYKKLAEDMPELAPLVSKLSELEANK